MSAPTLWMAAAAALARYGFGVGSWMALIARVWCWVAVLRLVNWRLVMSLCFRLLDVEI